MERRIWQWLRAPITPPPLRPPGARPEAQFVALCLRCNRCVAVCSYRALKPASWAHSSGAGTPVCVPRETPCYLCMLCPPVCPTGALAPITDRSQVRMGRAEINQQACYAFQGILCRTCIDECPLAYEAIVQDAQLRPKVTDHCVGCGICEKVCPAADVAIRVAPHGDSG